MGFITPLMAIASPIMGLIGESQEASAANARAQQQQQRQQEFVRDRDNSLRIQNESLRAREQQEKEAQARSRFQATREREQGKSTAKVAATAGGVQGISIDSLLDDFNLQTSFFTESSKKQEEFIAANTQAQTAGNQVQRTQDVRSALTAPQAKFKPDYGTAALRIGAGLARTLG